ncbi:type II toxin-antitoxin system RelE/ParE family toxin [Pinirhizobacter sp.]|uniref:type II toxin-antitoxin system RelE/ParE family toxin n=1 Tax=Pinirhizobacter sp. TaxID=2950432 RepID=UPI002F41D5EA
MYKVIMSTEGLKWLGSLRDIRTRTRIAIRIKRLELGYFGDAKNIGGLIELRIDHGPGYRLYLARRARTTYLLLIGGDKSTQSRDIATARKMLAALPAT